MQFVSSARVGNTMDLLLVFGFILCSLLFLFVLKNISKPPSYPPGPTWLPIVGSYLQIHALKSRLRYLHLVWTELARQYGPLVGLRLGEDYVVVVSGHHAVKEVLTKDEFTGRPDGFYFRMRTFNKRLGVAFTDGNLWQKHRHFTMHHLRQLGLGRDGMENLVIKDEWLMPFGIGKRRCLAEDLAKNNMYLFLGALLQNFTFDLLPEETPPTLEPIDGMSLSPQPFSGLVTPRY